jgi:poly(3-hydroxybutyrate) depolymerase
MDKGIDDVGFLEQIVSQLPGRFSANPKRVYVSGKSAGGVLVHAALCK